MKDHRTMVIVGAGAEPERPYERPPLSKAYLQGTAERDDAFVHPEEFYDDHDIELRTSTRATALAPDDRLVVLDDGERLHYDRLLLATGAEPRRLAVPGAELAGVHLLRTLDDADRLRAALDPATKVVVIGSGWIGSEVAASARTLGKDVTLVGRDDVPLARVLGSAVGVVFRQLHADHGVHLAMN